MDKNTGINKTKELQNLMQNRPHQVKCSECKAIVFTKDLKEWKQHKEVCFNCRSKQDYSGIVCKFCGSADIIKQGMRQIKSRQTYIQRFRCKSCKKKFVYDIDRTKSNLEELKQKFELLMNLREQYFDFMYGDDRKGGLIEELEKHFSIQIYDAFQECNDREFTEFFHMGEGKSISWDELENIVNRYKELLEEES